MIFGPGANQFRLILAAVLLSCSAVGSAAEILLVQANGSKMSLAAPATRIVTLSPHLAELVFAAGAGDQLIATVEYSDYPEAAADIPRIGDAFRLDSERVMALRPDLVIAWDSGNPRPAIDQLRSLGLPVWSVEIREPMEIADTLETIGLATGHETTARLAAENIRTRLANLSIDYGNAAQRRYFYQVGAKPLFTINGDHLISKGLQLCGGLNIFDQEPGLAFQVGYESVIVADPDALFAPDNENRSNPLSAWLEWPTLYAVQQDALFLLPADAVSRASPRFFDALELACKLLHVLPERRTDGKPIN